MTENLLTEQPNLGELRFRKLIEHSYAGVTLLDRDLNVVYRSPSAERITGWNSENRLTKTAVSLVHPSDQPILKQVLNEIFTRPGEPATARFRTQHYDGHYIWIACNLTNLLAEPEVAAIVFNFVDVTRQVELESAQLQSQALLAERNIFIQAVTDNLPAMIAYFSADLRCQFANQPYRDHFGNGSAVIGELKTNLLSPEEYQAHERHVIAVLEGKRQSFERTFSGPDGHTIYTHTQYLPDGQPGGVKGFYSLIYDVSEVKAAENEAGRKSTQMEELLASITDGFIAADSEQRYTYVNKRLGEMVGMRPDEMIGQRIWDLFPDAVGSVTYHSIQEALQEKRYVFSEDYYAPLDLWQENRIYPTADGFSMFVHDITGRKKADEQLRLLFDRAPDMIGILGLDRYFKKVNPAMCTLLEYTEEELLVLPLDALVYIDDLESSRERTKAFIAGGSQTIYFENRFVTKSGKPIWLSWTVSRSAGEGLLFCIGKNIGDKKELEQLLHKANELARIGSWEVDRVNGTAYWSPITREIYEVLDDFVPGIDNWLSFYRKGPDRDYIAGKMQHTIITGQPCDAEVEMVTAQGNLRWIRAMAEAEFSNGVCVRVYGSFQDIDSRKKAELAAISSLAERNMILESIGDGFFAVDNDWIVTYWNATAEQTLGMPRENVLGKYFWDVYKDAQDLGFYQHYQRAMATGEVVHFEDYYPAMDIWFGVSAYPAQQGLSVFFKNITDSKRTLEALAESEKRYSDLFQLSPQPMFVYDLDSLVYLDVNPAAIDHYGYSREEFLAMTILDIRPEEDIPLVLKTVAALHDQTKVRLHGVFRHRKKNGEVIQVDIQSNLITYQGIHAKVVLANDVTERVRYIQAIEAQNEKLKEISWMQSHVIRAPLSRIMGLVPMLSETDKGDPEQQKIREFILTSANELDQVIRSITDVTSEVKIF